MVAAFRAALSFSLEHRCQRFAPYPRLYLSGNLLEEAAKAKQLDALKAAGVRIEG